MGCNSDLFESMSYLTIYPKRLTVFCDELDDASYEGFLTLDIVQYGLFVYSQKVTVFLNEDQGWHMRLSNAAEMRVYYLDIFFEALNVFLFKERKIEPLSPIGREHGLWLMHMPEISFSLANDRTAFTLDHRAIDPASKSNPYY